jgi:hypothetical protein
LTVVSLAVQDFYTYLSGGTSVIGTVIDQYGQTNTLLGAMIRLFEAVGNVASAAFGLIEVAFMAAWNAAAPFRDLLSDIAGIAGGVVVGALNGVASALTTILDLLTPVINGLATVLGSQAAIGGAQAIGGAAGSLATGGIAGAALAPGAASLASALAPTAPASAPSARGNQTVNVQIAGATINGSGLDEAALTRVLAQPTANQARQTQSSLLGLQV